TFFAGHAGAFNSLEHDPENACPGLDPGRMPVLQKRSCSTKKSERKPVAAVRADYQLTITFHEMAAPRPVLAILCLLNGRCRDRRVSYGRCADWNCACARRTGNAKPSRQAKQEQCVTHGYLLRGTPHGQTATLRFGSACCNNAPD